MKWEYLVEPLPDLSGTNVMITTPFSPQQRIQDYLNQRGSEGWELVQYCRQDALTDEVRRGGIYEERTVFTFKRPMP